MGRAVARGVDALTQAERDRKILALRLAGLTYQAIGEQVGCSVGLVHKVIHRRVAERVAPVADELRQLEADRLDRLQAAVWGDALQGDVAAVREARALSESRRKLFGLDAPTRVDVDADVTARVDAHDDLLIGYALEMLHMVVAVAGTPYAQRSEFIGYGMDVFLYLMSGRQGDPPTPPVLEAEEVHVELLPTEVPQVQTPRFPTYAELRAEFYGDNDAQA